jgi:hypothetical protein
MNRKLMVVLAALMPLAMVGADRPGKSGDDDKLDKKALEIIKKTGALYKDAKTMSVEGTISSKTGDAEAKEKKATYEIERPNKLAFRSKGTGGLEVIADGKNISISMPDGKKYAQEESPKGLGDIGLKLLSLGVPNTGMLFGNILGDDPADALMQGVNSCSLVGTEKIDGTPTHRMKFSQDQFDWELFVAAEGKPYVLRMVSVIPVGDAKITTTETYKNWKLNEPLPQDAFKFTAPKGAEKVDSLDRPR